MSMADSTALRALFEPRSIAVLGASEDASRIGGGLVLKFLQTHRYGGTIYPVNPKYETVNGLECFATLESIPGPIDLAVVTIPARATIGAIRDIPHGHVKVFLIITSGFGELGEEGKQLERELIDLIHSKGARAVGPNSVGLANLRQGVVPAISQVFDNTDLASGDVAMVSQSGAVGAAILTEVERQGVGVDQFMSSGNEADLEFSDFGRYLLDDPGTRIIGGYIESIRNGASFSAFARDALERGKPVVVLKVGRSEAGAVAARSHTGALVGSDAVVQSVFDANGVIRAQDGDHFIDLLKVLSRTPESRGKRIALLSHSGGAGVMAADAATEAGLDVVPLPESLRAKVAEVLPAFAGFNNPLDMTGGMVFFPETMAKCLQILLESDHYDAAVLSVKLIWRHGVKLVEELAKVHAAVGKPFAVSWVAPNPDAVAAIRTAPFPVFSDPARATRSIAARLLYDDHRRALLATPAPARDIEPGVGAEAPLDNVEAQRAALEAYGIRLPRETVAGTVEEAEAFRGGIGGPVAVKIASPDIAHRTEIGAVVIGVDDPDALAVACEQVNLAARRHHPKARIDGILVQEMVTGGLEVLIGMKRDPVFGPVIVFGPGGTLVELIRDVTMLPAPVGEERARQALERSILGPLLRGYRGQGALDADALARTLARLSWLAVDRESIAEIDLNPVLVRAAGQGCVALDYKFTLEDGAGP
jgi:acyl-CoA synthetase (NDP forming)